MDSHVCFALMLFAGFLILVNCEDPPAAVPKVLAEAAPNALGLHDPYHYGKCYDRAPFCSQKKKFCGHKRHKYMEHYCPKTCKKCKDKRECRNLHPFCHYWGRFCAHYLYGHYVSSMCKITCDDCDVNNKWGKCSKSCGGGIQKRKHCDSGIKCRRSCNQQPCTCNDVMFMITSAVPQLFYLIEKNFIKKVLLKTNMEDNYFGFGDTRTRTSQPNLLAKYPNSAAAHSYLDNQMHYGYASESIVDALKVANHMISTSPRKGLRCNSPTIVLITGEGLPSNEFSTVQSQLTNGNVRFILVTTSFSYNSNYPGLTPQLVLEPDWNNIMDYADQLANELNKT